MQNYEEYVNIYINDIVKIKAKVLIPVQEHPGQLNYVGILIGVRGENIKRLQHETLCKILIHGMGSMRDRIKEERLRMSADPQFRHLFEQLHIEISAQATPTEANARIAYALFRIKETLSPTAAERAFRPHSKTTDYFGGAHGFPSANPFVVCCSCANRPTPSTSVGGVAGVAGAAIANHIWAQWRLAELPVQNAATQYNFLNQQGENLVMEEPSDEIYESRAIQYYEYVCYESETNNSPDE